MLPPMGFDRVAIVGAGAWGTARCANMIARAGRAVTADRPLTAQGSKRAGANAQECAARRIQSSMCEQSQHICVAPADAADRPLRRGLLAVPVQLVAREAAGAVAAPGCSTANNSTCHRRCGGHRAQNSRKFMTDVIAEPKSRRRRCRSRSSLWTPCFASPTWRAGLPAAVTLAANDEAVAAAIFAQRAQLDDIPALSLDRRARGRIGGAAKNVLAIGAGIVGAAAVSAPARSRGAHDLAASPNWMRSAERRRAMAGNRDGARVWAIWSRAAPARYRGEILPSALNIGYRGTRAGADIQRVTGLAEQRLHRPRYWRRSRRAAKVDMPITAAVAAVVAEDGAVDEAIDAEVADAAPGCGPECIFESKGRPTGYGNPNWIMARGRTGESRRQGQQPDRRSQPHGQAESGLR